MRITRRTLYAKAALITQRIGLSRLSWYCARRAGFFEKPYDVRKAETLTEYPPLAHRVFLYGYHGNVYPRFVRRLFARTLLHRAWLTGHMGVFEQEGRPHGVADRDNVQHRK